MSQGKSIYQPMIRGGGEEGGPLPFTCGATYPSHHGGLMKGVLTADYLIPVALY